MPRPLFFLLIALPALAEVGPTPWVNRLMPFGAARGTTVTVELHGERLKGITGAWFDTGAIRWIETVSVEEKKVVGKIAVAEDAARGPHIVNLRGKNGRSNSRLFNVLQFPVTSEAEPNDPPGKPQEIELKQQVIAGYMKGRVDVDVYRFAARAGERWTFDLRSLEYGAHLECEMALLDEHGGRVAFNDDRDDYLETPYLEHVFAKPGIYQIKLDQYRGPQQVTCAQNCGYLLQVSRLPLIRASDPLGMRAGVTTRIRTSGGSLAAIEQAWIAPVRLAEYYRLTFPYTIPVRPMSPARVDAKILRKAESELELEFDVPASAQTGLWRLWVRNAAGETDGISLEIGAGPEADEKAATPLRSGTVVNGRLSAPGEEDSFSVDAEAGKPLRFTTLAVQLGLPEIDTVLELFDANGKFLADHDDLMTGQGTVIGNPDSSLYYTPKESGRLKLVVRDRIGRGGTGYAYRLHIGSDTPGFKLLTEPEEFFIAPGKEADLEVLLIPDPGFAEPVEVWVEGLPPGITAGKGHFRADQNFGPSGDGDNVLIPSAHLKVIAAPEIAEGEYPIRVFGHRASGGAAVEAMTTLWIGAPRKRNDIRRPLPQVTVTVGGAE